jgi:xanthine dehydrogenase small subunit
MPPLKFLLNDRERGFSGPPEQTLLQWLRANGLTGTKEGCAEGDCGACTVVVVEADPQGKSCFRAINSCLVLMPTLQGRSVYTAEGLASKDALHPAQAVMVDRLGSQCGYCTPGFVMSLFEACYRQDLDASWKRDDQLCGTLCRCTGYRPIREAIDLVAGLCPPDRFHQTLSEPPAEASSVAFEAEGRRFFSPASLDELWTILAENPEARLIAGGTDLALDVTKRHRTFPCLVSLERIPSMKSTAIMPAGATSRAWVGAGVSLAQLEANPPAPAIGRMLRFFASRQIKNRASVGGNLCNASPIGDLAPVLIALGAAAVLASRAGSRALPIEDFFLGYRKTALRPQEILLGVEIPCDSRASGYKVSKRRELDISAVCAGMSVRLEAGGVAETRLAYGGMAAIPSRARHAEAVLVGRPFTEAVVREAMSALEEDFRPIDDHRSSAWYRMTVAKNLLLGFFYEVTSGVTPDFEDRPTSTIPGEVAP